MTNTPQFFVLTPAECAEVLERNHVGRLAFRQRRWVEMQPLGYVAQGRWIFLRSAYGAKLEAITRDPFVAFEVDEIEGPFDWRSVLVHGTIYVLQDGGGSRGEHQARRALDALRTVMPETLSESDPIPERQIIYGLHIQEVTGRLARTSVAATATKCCSITTLSPPTSRRPADTF